MSVFASIATIFIENLIAVTGLLAAAFMVAEYFRKRRDTSLVLFAGTLGVMGAGFMFGFVGQLLYVHLGGGIGETLVHTQKYFTSATAFLMISATAYAYRFRLRKAIAFTAALLFVVSAVVLAGLPETIAQVHGIPLSGVSLGGFFMGYSPWIFANFFLAAVSGLAFLRGRRTNRRYIRPDLFLFRSALIGLLVVVFSAALVSLELGGLLWLNYAALLAQLITLFLGATSKAHDHDAIAESPVNVVNRSLVFKALAVNTGLFWLLAFSLVVITATYFVSSLIAERTDVMTRDLRLLTTSHQNAGERLLDNATQFARHPALVDMVETGDVEHRAMEAVMRSAGDAGFVYVLDREGRLLYGTDTSNEVMHSLRMSSLVRRALDGMAVAGIERDPAHDAWTLRAAAPVVMEDGSVGGVVLGTDAVLALGLREFSEFTISRATGYGFISADGTRIFVAGKDLDAVALHGFQQKVSGTRLVRSETLVGDMFFVSGVQQTDGTYDGFFYIYLTEQEMNAAIFRILAVVMIFVTLFVLTVAAVLVFSMLIVLRPVRELKEAAERIEHGDYDLHVTYDKPDELGQLAYAFNEMSRTIKDRTTSLNEALRQQRDFLTHTAHEMRTPLNIFRWTLEMLRFGDTGPLNKEQLELIEQMHQTNERIRKLVMNLLDASRIERGTLDLHRDFIALEDIIDDAAGAVSVRIREKNINLHWNPPEGPLPKAYADQERLYQVMLNLLSNAVKYTHRNGHIEISVKETETSGPSGREGRFLEISVEDNGRGIPADQQRKIFTRFFRASNVVVEEIEGTGLGLFITKQIIDLHGGEVWFDSEEGTGTTFTFTVPTRKP